MNAPEIKTSDGQIDDPFISKRIFISGSTAEKRNKYFKRIKHAMKRTGWHDLEYVEAGEFASYATFRRFKNYKTPFADKLAGIFGILLVFFFIGKCMQPDPPKALPPLSPFYTKAPTEVLPDASGQGPLVVRVLPSRTQVFAHTDMQEWVQIYLENSPDPKKSSPIGYVKGKFLNPVTPLSKLEEREFLKQLKEERKKFEEEALTTVKAGTKPKVSSFDGSVIVVKEYLQSIMHDPDSLTDEVWFEVTDVKLGKKRFWLTRVKYRAKNSFGALVKQDKSFLIAHDKVIYASDTQSFLHELTQGH